MPYTNPHPTLFSFQPPSNNCLPCDGQVYNHGCIIPSNQASLYFEKLLSSIAWQNDHVFLYGKHHVTQRKVAWYGEAPFVYKYSGTHKKALPWSSELLEIKKTVEKTCQTTFNSCLLNRYDHGAQGMGWHSDDERTLIQHAPIASLSLGATRHFDFKHKTTKQKIRLWLEHGSLITMEGETQQHWQHSLPISKKIKQPRINLTFRCMKPMP
jgi:alkylated DNA repair dioxygenase AlkB